MHKSTKIFRIFGIDVKLHYSWYFIFILLTWSLATSFFPAYFEGYPVNTYWLMGIIASVLLFLSVLFHELSHSLVAKAKKIKVESITLFFFGGVAGITDEDMKPSSEFFMAIAGPLFSLFLSGVFFLIYKSGINGILTAITFYLYQINFILAIFNLVPGYPLDGGRAFRAILYGYYKDLKKATRIAAGAGKLFAGALIILGFLGLFGGAGGGLWFILIGGFLFFIAGVSYDQVLVKDVLDKVKVKELMKTKFKTLNPQLKFTDFLKKYGNSGEDVFYLKGRGFSGILNLNKINNLPLKMQGLIKIKQLATPLNQIKGIKPNDDAYFALQEFARQGVDLLPIKKAGKVNAILLKKVVVNRLLWQMKFSGNGRKIKFRRKR